MSGRGLFIGCPINDDAFVQEKTYDCRVRRGNCIDVIVISRGVQINKLKLMNREIYIVNCNLFVLHLLAAVLCDGCI